MVHIIIESLLSTSKNRPIIEALWFLAMSKSLHAEKSNINLESLSIISVCSELKSRLDDEEIDPQKFFFTTQLVFGTLQLYRIQIEKLYDQSKTMVQNWRHSIFNVEWLSQMSQKTPKQDLPPPKLIAKDSRKIENTSKKSTKKAQKKTVSQNAIPKNLLDDFELMENIFDIPRDDEEDFLSLSTSSRIKGKAGKEIPIKTDQTVTVHEKNITIMEPSYIANSSGYQTFANFCEDEDFGESTAYSFKNPFKSIPEEPFEDESFHCNRDNSTAVDSAIDETNFSNVSKSRFMRGRPTDITSKTDASQARGRRLTYSNVEAEDTVMRDAQVDFSVANPMSVYEMSNNREFTTFDENANARMESSKMPDLQLTTADAAASNQTITTVMHNTNQPLPEITENEISLPLPEAGDEPDLTLERLNRSETRARKRGKKPSKLIVDKHKMLSDDVILKNFETYKKKHCTQPPFDSFNMDMFYRKNCADALFAETSMRMKNSSEELQRIYRRNMAKISEKLQKQRAEKRKEEKENDCDQENQVTPPKKARPLRSARRALKELNQSKIDRESLTGVDVSSIQALPRASTPQPQQPDVMMQELFVMDIELPPIEPDLSHNESAQPHESSRCETEYVPSEKKRKTNAKQINKSLAEESEGSKQDGKAVLSKLKELWKTKNPATMDNLCVGQSRFVAARTFLELLVLKKSGVIDLIQEEGSLQIANITCLVSKKKLSML